MALRTRVCPPHDVFTCLGVEHASRAVESTAGDLGAVVIQGEALSRCVVLPQDAEELVLDGVPFADPSVAARAEGAPAVS